MNPEKLSPTPEKPTNTPSLELSTDARCNVLNYLHRFLKPEYQTDESRAAVLRADFDHLVRELSLIELTTRYSYQLDVDSGSLLGDGYQEDLTALTTGFIASMTEQNLPTDRATLETLLFDRVRQFWLQVSDQLTRHPDVPTYPVLLITSPPDSEANGYHGSDSLHNWKKPETHHTFFYAMRLEPSDPHTVKVSQFRTWHNLQDLLELHHELQAPVKIDPTQLLPGQLMENSILFSVPADWSDDQVEASLRPVLYQGSKTWGRQPDQAPHLAEPNDFLAESLAFFESFYLPQALPLFRAATTHSHEVQILQEKLESLNQVFSIYLSAVEQRIRFLNTNPKYESLVQKNVIRQMFKNPQALPQLVKQLEKPTRSKSLMENTPQIHKLFELNQKHTIDPRSLTKLEREWLTKQATDLVTLSGFAFGSAQCFTMAPFTLPLSVMRNGMEIGALPTFSAQLSRLTSEQKNRLLTSIQDEDHQERSFVVNGKTLTYMIPASYVDECWVENGMVMGPCGIPLDHDPVVFAMDKYTFANYLSRLRDSLNSEELERLQSLVAQKTTDSDRAEAQEILSQLEQKVLRKTLSFTEFLNNDVFDQSELFKFSHQWFELLSQAPNPLPLLKSLVFSTTFLPPQPQAA